MILKIKKEVKKKLKEKCIRDKFNICFNKRMMWLRKYDHNKIQKLHFFKKFLYNNSKYSFKFNKEKNKNLFSLNSKLSYFNLIRGDNILACRNGNL